MNAHAAPTGASRNGHLAELDGWRGISILCVLAAHLLPLGPSAWGFNETAALVGMDLFFNLSGFLITSFLVERQDVRVFFVRRFLRIVPLAWTALIVLVLLGRLELGSVLPSALFFQNYDFSGATPSTSHLWSLCIEVHFYLFVGLLVAAAGRKGLLLLPLLAVAVTIGRVAAMRYSSVNTHLRVDEILAGATLALIHVNQLPAWMSRPMVKLSPWFLLLLLLATATEHLGPLNYLRPYAGALLIGSTLYQPEGRLSKWLRAKWLAYLAAVSYALYVIHGPLRVGWFDEGSTAVRYLVKRPLTIGLTFLLAHLSTFYFESRFIALGKRLTRGRADRSRSVVPAARS